MADFSPSDSGRKMGKTGSKQDKTRSSDHGDNVVRLWVSNVIRFSSEYDPESWCARQVIGPPKVYPRHGDIRGAWASGDIDENQFLELQFEEPLYIQKIDIYETYHPGGVKRVLLKKPDGNWMNVWETAEVEVFQEARIFGVEVQETPFKTDQIRVDVDCSACETWVEIDAIQIEGRRYKCEPPPSVHMLSQDLSALVNNILFSDVTFKVEDMFIYGHRAILAVRSDYFRAMFCDDMKESQSKEPIMLKDVQKEPFLALMHFIYTNQIPDHYTCPQLTQIWRVADRFSVSGLKALSTCKIGDKVAVDTVVDCFVEATGQLPVIEEVKNICLTFIKYNMAAVSRSPSFVDLPQTVMLEIIQDATANLKIQ